MFKKIVNKILKIPLIGVFDKTFNVLSTVNIEALACGCPVTTYNTDGSVAVITNESAYIVEQGNVDELKKVLENITFQKFNRNLISSKANNY